MRPSRPAGRSAEQGAVGSACAIASAIPRFSNGLVAIYAHSARSRQQAFQGFAAIALLDVATKLGYVARAKFGDGRARGDPLLDRIEGPAIVILALGRQHILIAVQAVLQASRIRIDAAAVRIDVLGTA